MKNKTIIYLSLLFVFSFCTGFFESKAQEIKASAVIDSTVLPIGQQTRVHLELIQPKDLVVKLPVFQDTLIDKVEILEQSGWDSIGIADMQISLKKELLVTSFDSGFYFIPPVQYEIENGGGFVESNPMILKVITFEVDTTKGVFDIKTVKEVPYTFDELVPWLIGAVLALIVIFVFIFLIRKIKGKEPIFVKKEKPKDPPHVIALRDLDELKASKLWQTDRVKEFYIRLTDILRTYIEDRYHIPALEQISDEIISSLNMADHDIGSAMQNLEQILSTADLVKFAKHKPLPDENDLSLVDAYLFVNQTKVVEMKSLDEVREEMEGDSDGKPKTEADQKEDELANGEALPGSASTPPAKKKGESELAEKLRRMSEGEDVLNKNEEGA